MASNIKGVGDPSAVAEMAARSRRDNASAADTGTSGAGGPPTRDAVHITDVATRLQAAENRLANVPVVDTHRVEQVRQAISDGSYQVNTHRTAAKLVDFERSLASATGDGDGDGT